MDRRKVTFLDVLIEGDQKTVVSNAAVRPCHEMKTIRVNSVVQVQS